MAHTQCGRGLLVLQWCEEARPHHIAAVCQIYLCHFFDWIRLLNEQGNALVAVGSCDGTVRLWRNVLEENASLLTAWTSGCAVRHVIILLMCLQ